MTALFRPARAVLGDGEDNRPGGAEGRRLDPRGQTEIRRGLLLPGDGVASGAGGVLVSQVGREEELEETLLRVETQWTVLRTQGEEDHLEGPPMSDESPLEPGLRGDQLAQEVQGPDGVLYQHQAHPATNQTVPVHQVHLCRG